MPLDVRLLANTHAPIGASIGRLLGEYRKAFFAVAYGTHEGLRSTGDVLLGDFVRTGGSLRVVLDVDRHFTDPDLIDEFCTIPGDVECRLHAPRLRGLTAHPSALQRDDVRLERRGDFVYRIQLRFSRQSPIWRLLQAQVRQTADRRLYAWPEAIDFGDAAPRRSFLQGYMDIRTRVTATDALPPPLPLMRVAVSVGGHAPEFANRLRDLMAAEFGCDAGQINLLGGRRAGGREIMLRIPAELIPPNFLQSPWQRIVVEDFRAHNEALRR